MSTIDGSLSTSLCSAAGASVIVQATMFYYSRSSLVLFCEGNSELDNWMNNLVGFREGALMSSFSLPHQLTQTHTHAQSLSKPLCRDADSVLGIV